jgi:hypothetical protein
MARELLEYFDPSTDGYGLEGLISWANSSMDNWLIPLFILVFYSLAIYLASKNEYKMGGQLILISLFFFILGMIAQIFTQFNQLIMFLLALGAIVGIVISFMENKS